jgi:hypothetical protein
MKANGSETKSCLGRIFNSKLGYLYYECNSMAYTSTPTSRVEYSAQVLFCKLKLTHVGDH